MIQNVLKVSPHGSFQVTQLCDSVAICEATNGDQHGWGNATDTEPAFIAYLGCRRDEIKSYLSILQNSYRVESCEVRNPKYLKHLEVEIKIKGMRREGYRHVLGLDALVEDQMLKEGGCPFGYDQYNQYTTGYLPRW